MCGINGFFNTSRKVISDEQSLVAKMNAAVKHRGPDDSGYLACNNGRVHLGHVRLSIIDLSSSGHQPMVSDKGTTIIFNGEIYNYKELKDQLSLESYHTASDTEVILKYYEKYGSACVDHFKGMFAFALWDPSKEELFLARDFAGKKPLYYTMQEGVFAFASEIKSLLALPWIKPRLDEEAFYHFLTFNLLPPPRTMFRDIYKMYPGTWMKVNGAGTITSKKFREINVTDLSSESLANLENQTYEKLQDAVRYRMVSDVPVGAFLSGGVDSSAIVAMMSRMTEKPVKTYSIGFENQPAYDELKYAGQVSKMFGTEHYEKIVTEGEMMELIPRMAEIFDEPLADSTSIPIYFISKMARGQGSKVVLTGDGSDELFAGYKNYARYLVNYPRYRSFSKLPGFFKKGVAQMASAWNENAPATEMFHRAALGQEFFWGEAKSFKESVKRKMLSPGFRIRSEGWNSYDVILEYRKEFDQLFPKGSDLDWMCFIGFRMADTNRFLYRADRLGMAHSIELRAPFMDNDLIDFAFSVPGKFKWMNGEPKYILKKSLERILPEDILYRKKMGFNVPLREWAGGMMTDFVESHLHAFCESTGLFNEEELRQTVRQTRQGNENTVNDLWTLYFLMAWFKKWMPS